MICPECKTLNKEGARSNARSGSASGSSNSNARSNQDNTGNKLGTSGIDIQVVPESIENPVFADSNWVLAKACDWADEHAADYASLAASTTATAQEGEYVLSGVVHVHEE